MGISSRSTRTSRMPFSRTTRTTNRSTHDCQCEDRHKHRQQPNFKDFPVASHTARGLILLGTPRAREQQSLLLQRSKDPPPSSPLFLDSGKPSHLGCTCPIFEDLSWK